MERALGIGLIGFGTIGTGVVRLLQSQAGALQQRVGAPLRLVRIADVDIERDRGVAVPRDLLTRDGMEVAKNPDVDIVVELVGGYEPARSFVREAIRAGKCVVTANKALLAVHGAEIFRQAEDAGVLLGFEASVGGGIPIVRTLRQALVGDRIRAIYGIVNGTSNYILSEMTRAGAAFEDVLARAQAQGLAEADPTFDVDGIDAAHKLCLLIQLAFGRRVPFEAIPVEGIRQVSPVDIQYADELGYVIKLLAIAKLHGTQVEARVAPTMIPREHVLSDVNGAYNGIVVQGEALGQTFYYGLGAGMMPTATAVVADIVEAARFCLGGSDRRPLPLGYPYKLQRQAKLVRPESVESEFYLRLSLADRPGVLAQVAGILGREQVSIAAMVQRGRHQNGWVPVVLRTHRTSAGRLRKALQRIARSRVVKGPVVSLSIEEELGREYT
ncbi:MAG: homoserine dehydrogenase [Candidatus Binatia bacterium]|nr:MAG: homoserine dehydrogenase [Candidatus Binatia bacterium]